MASYMAGYTPCHSLSISSVDQISFSRAVVSLTAAVIMILWWSVLAVMCRLVAGGGVSFTEPKVTSFCYRYLTFEPNVDLLCVADGADCPTGYTHQIGRSCGNTDGNNACCAGELDCMDLGCNGHGTCVPGSPAVCECDIGFYGTFCEKVGLCTHTFSEGTGNVYYPSTPDTNYEDSFDCLILIDPPPGSLLKLNFHKMDIEYHSACGFDTLRIQSNNIDKEYCIQGSVPFTESLEYTGGVISVNFTTDSSRSYTGFNFTYEITDPPCGITATSQARLLGETDVQDAHPWAVVIYAPAHDFLVGHGVMVARDKVIVPAIVARLCEDNCVAIFGRYDLADQTNEVQVAFSSENVTYHPGYSYDGTKTGDLANGLAIVFLSENVHQDVANVLRSCPPQQPPSCAYQLCRTFGFGLVSDTVSQFASVRQTMDVYHVTQPQLCSVMREEAGEGATPANTTCALASGTICFADDGIAVMCQDTDTGAWHVQGLIQSHLLDQRPPGLCDTQSLITVSDVYSMWRWIEPYL